MDGEESSCSSASSSLPGFEEGEGLCMQRKSSRSHQQPKDESMHEIQLQLGKGSGKEERMIRSLRLGVKGLP